MEEKVKETSAVNETDEDEGRPPVDPNNKLYTFLSLLIFAVLYAGWQFVKDEFSVVYAMHNSAPSDACTQIVMRETGIEVLPKGWDIDYFRVCRGFDDNALYISLLLSEDMDMEDMEEFIPYDFGNIVEDERFTIYRNEDMIPDYVYGSCYVCIDDPKKSVLVYENDGRLTAMFRTVDYSSEVTAVMKEGVKIKPDSRSGR